MNTQRQPQRQKFRNGKVNYIQDLRRSNAAVPIPSKKTREEKYGILSLEDDIDDDYSAFDWIDNE